MITEETVRDLMDRAGILGMLVENTEGWDAGFCDYVTRYAESHEASEKMERIIDELDVTDLVRQISNAVLHYENRVSNALLGSAASTYEKEV